MTISILVDLGPHHGDPLIRVVEQLHGLVELLTLDSTVLVPVEVTEPRPQGPSKPVFCSLLTARDDGSTLLQQIGKRVACAVCVLSGAGPLQELRRPPSQRLLAVLEEARPPRPRRRHRRHGGPARRRRHARHAAPRRRHRARRAAPRRRRRRRRRGRHRRGVARRRWKHRAGELAGTPGLARCWADDRGQRRPARRRLRGRRGSRRRRRRGR
mmetsp:Transcript_160387/g.514738  ORF Transcript_160387/g.514738 Transcript_160387/m.514738 type:complete len:213 (+) Transcript_160387:1713-2351(+)